MEPLVPGVDLIRPRVPVLTGGSMSESRARQVAEDFEASFVSAMLKPMFEGLSTEAPFGGGMGEETWRSFLVDAMARQTVRAGGIGLADDVMREILSLQQVQTPTSPDEQNP